MTRGYRGLQRIIETFFLTRTFPDTFSWSILNKKSKLKKSQIFDQNDGLTPLEKCQFCGFLKPMISLFRKVCLLYKTSKIVFSLFIFTIYAVHCKIFFLLYLNSASPFHDHKVVVSSPLCYIFHSEIVLPFQSML